jgi:hypothetical protein
MRAIEAPVGVGIDASTYLPPEKVRLFKDAGYGFRIGYLRRDHHVNDGPDLSWPTSTSRRELAEHLEAGMPYGFYQFGAFLGRSYLSAAAGLEAGRNAGLNAKDLGTPEGVHIFCDAEWTDSPGIQSVMSYLRAWCNGVAEHYYSPAIYNGFDELTGDLLYSIPLATAYARSAMRLLCNPQPRGYSLFQGWEHSKAQVKHGRPPIFGCSVDVCFSTYDDSLAHDRFNLIGP